MALAEFLLARLAHGVADATIRSELASAGVWAWEVGELHELTGRLVASPIDECNRPRHSGDFTVRVPPTPAAWVSSTAKLPTPPAA